jgi:predicted dehydrogenase/nucleoside-diphosphate-sugar epimerase
VSDPVPDWGHPDAGVGPAVAARPLQEADTPSPKPRLRTAFIGTGNIAGLHLQALRQLATPHTVVGVHDAKWLAAQAFAARAGTRAYAALRDLLEQARPDIVHVCTPAGSHFEPARQALLAGAHVYVEKPFVETSAEAETLFALARERALLICAGHQLLRDPAYTGLVERIVDIRPITFVDSYFAFRPPRLQPHRSSRHALAEQLLDVVPHPLYTLVAALDCLNGGTEAVEVVHVSATPTDLHALLRAGQLSGRLCVSLRARPVASTLTVAGEHGTLTADFVRAILLGAANEGTSPLEKVANPFVEAGQLASRSAASLARRLARRATYPGLTELLEECYAAAAAGGRSPLSVDHLRAVTGIYEELATRVRRTIGSARARKATVGPLAVVTGAAGFFGQAITRALASRGFRVRGVGRSDQPDDPHVHEWVRADLAERLPAAALANAAVVVHAAAETAGGFEAHERNTVRATHRVLDAMAAAGVRRLVLVSSLSVVRPPRRFWERQTERTPRASRPERLGAYAWGKCTAEQLVETAQGGPTLQVRIVRPAALVDLEHIEFPGLLGRRLFGRWHLGLGHPGLPFAVCEVDRAAAAIAWCADHFAEAPRITNLIDPAIPTRGQVLALLREHGWRGKVIWVPIGVMAAVVHVGRRLAALVRGESTRPLAAWSILRPRRYDTAVATSVLAAAFRDDPTAEASTEESAALSERHAYA